MHEGPYSVSDVMTLTVVAVGRAAPFKDIVRAMEQWRVSAVPVIDDGQQVVGVVSEADLLPEEEFLGSDPGLVGQRRRPAAPAGGGAPSAQELMSAPAVTVRADAPLARAARLMAVHGFRRLPVVDDEGGLIGIVSRSDLLKVFLRPDEEIEDEIRRTVVLVLFPGLSRTITVHVREGVVTLAGQIPDALLVAVAARLARAVEGVVGVESRLSGPSGGPGGEAGAGEDP